MISAQVQENPFPGLRPFEASEHHLFFGRDGQSDAILRRLRRHRFLAVIGTSGSGKSSLIRAGLLPLLYGGFMTPAGSRWRVAIFRPGSDPIGNLARDLNARDVLGEGNDEAAPHALITETTLRRSALGLINVFQQARLPAQENLLIVVDQFEELFRFKQHSQGEHPEDEAAAFVKLLLEAARQHELPIYIVITMRSDFLGDCAQFRDLPEAINEGLYLIPRMTRDQRREAITGPVAVGGATISPRLLNRLLNDVGDNPDQLPILQHALMRTWDYWAHHHEEGEPLDFHHYEAIGCMAEALSRHADEAYFALPSDRHTALAERLFKSLTEKGPDNREIRRPTRLRDLCSVTEADEAEVTAVIESFRHPGRSFLMPPADVALEVESLIDISHESLIRVWQRLKDWVDQEALSAGIYRRLAETAVLYREGKAGLWHDPDLQVALGWREQSTPNTAWAEQYHPEFETAMQFLDASRAARDAAALEHERQQKKELRRTQLFVVILGSALLIATALGIHAFRKQAEAQAAQKEAGRKQAEAQAAQKEAEQKQRKAEQLAWRMREENLDNNRTVANLADQLIAVSPPQQSIAWRRYKELALSKIGNHEDAINETTRVLETDLHNLPARHSRGYEYILVGKPAEAVQDLQLYLQAVPQSSTAHLNLGISLGMLGQYEEATSAIDTAITTFVDDGSSSFDSQVSPDIQRVTGQLVIVANNNDFKTALHYEHVNLLAFAGCSAAAFDDALQRAHTESKKASLDAHLMALNWAWLHLRQRPEDYGGLASQGAIAERASVMLDDLQVLAQHYYTSFVAEHRRQAEPRYDELAQWVERRLRELGPFRPLPVQEPDAHALAVEAKELQERGKQREAYLLLTQAIAKDPTNIGLLLQRVEVRYKVKDYAGVRKDCERILELAPRTPLAYLYLAYSYDNKEVADKRKAEEYYRKVLDYDPANRYALDYLSAILAQANRDEEALSLLERRINIRSDDAEAFFRQAQLQSKTKRYPQALQSINTAIAMKSDELGFYDEREKIEQRLGKNPIEAARHKAAGYKEAGDTLLRLGRPGEALSTYLHSLELLAGLQGQQTYADLYDDMLVTIRKVSSLVEEQDSRASAVQFWHTVLESGSLKGAEDILRYELKRLTP